METKNITTQRGSVLRIVLILGAVVLIITIIIFAALRIVSSKKAAAPQNNESENKEPPKPVYETTVGDIKFTLQSSLDLGNFLRDTASSYRQDLATTERFIKVTIGAQNKGKNETGAFSWDVGSIIDSEGRVFLPITNKAYNFLPRPDLCGAILKPEFTPVPCVRMYEVSKQSKDLKIQVISKVPKQSVGLLDLHLVR